MSCHQSLDAAILTTLGGTNKTLWCCRKGQLEAVIHIPVHLALMVALRKEIAK